jgi:hypothetical protein
MHRCMRTIQHDMVRFTTGKNPDNGIWASLSREFRDTVGFWFNAHAIATFAPSDEEDPEERANDRLRLRKLLGVEQVSDADSICVREAVRQLVREAANHDDVDEAIWAMGAYLRLEEGQKVSHRAIVDRNNTTDEGDGRFLAKYVSRPRDLEWEHFEAWYEDPFLEGDYGDGPPPSVSRRQAWWEQSELVLAEPQPFRLERDCPNLTDGSLQNAALALQPIFSAVGRENRYGLNIALWSLLDFVAARSNFVMPAVTDVDEGRDRPAEELSADPQSSKTEKAA